MDIVDEMIVNEYLPINMVPKKEIWEKLGFVFEGSDKKGYYFARLPQGWVLSPNLIDESISIIDDSDMFRGRINCSLEYPSMKLYRRFDICIRTKIVDGNMTRETYHPATGDVIFCLELRRDMNPTLKKELEKNEISEIEKTIIYLNYYYPNWGSYFAYWDDDLEKESDDVLKSSEVYRKRVL